MDYKERNKKINKERNEGKTLQELAEKYHISRERVRQIVELFEQRAKLKKESPVLAKLPTKVINAMKLHNMTLQDVSGMDFEQLIRFRHFGPKTARLVKRLAK